MSLICQNARPTAPKTSPAFSTPHSAPREDDDDDDDDDEDEALQLALLLSIVGEGRAPPSTKRLFEEFKEKLTLEATIEASKKDVVASSFFESIHLDDSAAPTLTFAVEDEEMTISSLDTYIYDDETDSEEEDHGPTETDDTSSRETIDLNEGDVSSQAVISDLANEYFMLLRNSSLGSDYQDEEDSVFSLVIVKPPEQEEPEEDFELV